jgi:hypothetical protein
MKFSLSSVTFIWNTGCGLYLKKCLYNLWLGKFLPIVGNRIYDFMQWSTVILAL